jgi:hypothetical protein
MSATAVRERAVKALTVCQPYADLICLPDDHPRAKRVENRTWPTSYRGPLLIHAGKSRQWLTDHNYGMPTSGMVFGAIVGVANLAGCFEYKPHMSRMDQIYGGHYESFPWLREHKHVEGPWCWVLTECRRFEEPIEYRGAQGLFNVPREVVESAFRRL